MRVITFSLEAFIQKNNSVATKSLLSFLEVEINRSGLEEIVSFLKNSSEGDEKELTDHFIVKLSLLEVLIYNETIERFAQNPSEYRFIIDIAQLLYIINKKMFDGILKGLSFFLDAKVELIRRCWMASRA